MRRPPVVFREAPRFIPVRQREQWEATRLILRPVLIYGPVLGLLSLWLAHWLHDGEPLPLRLLIGLPLAPLTLAAIFASVAGISRIPALAPGLLYRWSLRPAVLLIHYPTGVRSIPWKNLHSPRIEETADEITLHVSVRHRRVDRPLSLTCLRSEMPEGAAARFVDAVNHKTLRATANLAQGVLTNS